ncbi:MAG: PQQ-binding-like beta-propeller repeat protein [Bacillota bacterium]
MVFYFVQPGETLFAIARRYRTTVHALVAANRLKDPNAISPGQALLIPGPGEQPAPPPGVVVHRVRRGETVFRLAARYGTPVRAILQANHLAHPEFVAPGQRLVIPEPPDPGPDWPMWGRGPGRAAAGPAAPAAPPRHRWSRRAGRSAAFVPSAPVTRDGLVFAGLGDGCFCALDQRTGAVRWRTGGEAAPGARGAAAEGADPAALPAPAVYDGLAYLCEPGGRVRAVVARTGAEVWAVAPGERPGSPLAAEGVVYLGHARGVVALEAKTGARVWSAPLDGPVARPVALGDGRLFAVTEAGTLWALDVWTGKPIWQAEAAPVPPVFAELLVIAGGRALDALTGEEIWHRPDLDGSPAVRGERVCYPGRWVDLFSGRTVAEAQGEAEPPPADAPHLLAGDLHVWATPEPALAAWDGAAGRLRWSVPLPAPAVALAPADGWLFVTLADGSLAAYSTAEED